MNINIKYINSKYKPRDRSYRNTVVLIYDGWNDFGYRTSFGMYYFDLNGVINEIGFPKIYHMDIDGSLNSSMHTKELLTDDIKQLNKEFCSLGNNLNYYKNLRELLPYHYIDILIRLNDIAFNEEIRKVFIKKHGVQLSLLRFSDAEKAMYEANKVYSNEIYELLDEDDKENDISFEYSIVVPYDSAPSKILFDYKLNEYLPYRINCIIGKNGVGKTQILSKIAKDLSGYNKDEINPFNKRPLIDKVLSISYSAFDPFIDLEEIDEIKRYSYVYCGIKDEKGIMSIDEIKIQLTKSLQLVKKKNRISIWEKALKELFHNEDNKLLSRINDYEFENVNFSSGQYILVFTITEIIANIESGSMILFDEPELHLHPNAISNVMRMINLILEEYKSYALFTTHSSHIVQEIPSKYIHIFDRIENMLFIRSPSIECFGSNISDITREVFEVRDIESNYKNYFDILLKKNTYEEILNIFDNKLSMNAMIYLKASSISK